MAADPLFHKTLLNTAYYALVSVPLGVVATNLGSGQGVLFRRGDVGDAAYVIITGDAEVSVATDSGEIPVARLHDGDFLGEMGIANTTAAACVCHSLFGLTAEDWTGRGTGIDEATLAEDFTSAGAQLTVFAGLREDPFFFDVEAFFRRIELDQFISTQRRNGLAGMVNGTMNGDQLIDVDTAAADELIQAAIASLGAPPAGVPAAAKRTVIVTGASDDVIDIAGDFYEEFPLKDHADGDLLAFSDGTVLRVQLGPDAWRITPVVIGAALQHIDQAAGDDGTDTATLTGDIRWVVHGIDHAKPRPGRR